MKIPFTKTHGAGNDFLLTRAGAAPAGGLPELARSICNRHTGIGADGWYRVEPAANDWDASIRLFNSDGGEAELSGNGTRCVAAFLVDAGLTGSEIRIMTGGGSKSLRLIERDGLRFQFDMDMGAPVYGEEDVRVQLPLVSGPREVTILDVGNPQCIAFVESLSEGWLPAAREIEGHSRFPSRTNVAFVRVIDEHSVEARFFERGAGETLSSGTGSTGAVVAAVLRGLVRSPVRVLTPAGHLDLRWERSVYLTGPAEIVARGEYYWKETGSHGESRS